MSDTNGISGGLQVTTLPLAMTMAGFTAIAWYNVVDLNVIIWMTFKKRRGLYFYSLLASSWGILVFALAFLMKFFQVWKNNYVSVTLITIGWYAMVTGQSLVLYSRLHLVVRDKRKIKWVLYMILVDVVLFHFPTSVLTFGANSSSAAFYATPYSIMEKVQVTGFFIQECIISGLYLYYTRQILKPGVAFQKKRFRRVMLHLLYVNLVVILMDIALICTEYANLYEIQITFKSALYSIKLRLEFAVLNQLRTLTSPGNSSYDNQPNTNSAPDVTLATFNHPKNLQQPPKVYSCTASRLTTSPFEGQIEDNRVMMTTEVVVHREDHDKIDEELASARSNMKSNGRQHSVPSPNSSEAEFAEAGY